MNQSPNYLKIFKLIANTDFSFANQLWIFLITRHSPLTSVFLYLTETLKASR